MIILFVKESMDFLILGALSTVSRAPSVCRALHSVEESSRGKI